MFNMSDEAKLRLRPATIKRTRQTNHSFIVRAVEVWNHSVDQVLAHKDLVNGKIVQQLDRSKKPSVVMMQTKLYDLSFSIPSTKAKLKKLMLTRQSHGDAEWIESNHRLADCDT